MSKIKALKTLDDKLSKLVSMKKTDPERAALMKLIDKQAPKAMSNNSKITPGFLKVRDTILNKTGMKKESLKYTTKRLKNLLKKYKKNKGKVKEYPAPKQLKADIKALKKEGKAESKSQQKLMGMVHAYQSGNLDNFSDLPKSLQNKIKRLANNMSSKQTKEYAETKHKGLPEKKAEYVFNKIAKEDNKKTYPISRFITSPITAGSVGTALGAGIGAAKDVGIALLDMAGDENIKNLEDIENIKFNERSFNKYLNQRNFKSVLPAALIGGAGFAGMSALNKFIYNRALKGKENKKKLKKQANIWSDVRFRLPRKYFNKLKDQVESEKRTNTKNLLALSGATGFGGFLAGKASAKEVEKKKNRFGQNYNNHKYIKA